jgi:hypothetical protein
MFRKHKQHVCEWQAIAYVKNDINLHLYKANQRVRELHKPFGENNEWCDHCEIGQNSGYDWAAYPCDTIKALDGITDEA